MAVLQVQTSKDSVTIKAAAVETEMNSAPPDTGTLSTQSARRRRLSHLERRLSSSSTQHRVGQLEPNARAAPVAGYSTDSYWNSRYAERSTHFDWFYTYTALAELISTVCDSQSGACLHVGCGNSGLSDGMAQDGFRVMNLDISQVVIEQMRLMDQYPGQEWQEGDCRSMPQYADNSFGSVLDKGTLDAVLCSSHGVADAAAYISEVHRLLVPGGSFLLVSLGQPNARLATLNALPAAHSTPLLPCIAAGLQQRSAAPLRINTDHPGSSSNSSANTAPSWKWASVEVYLLPKPNLYMQSESSLTGKPIATYMPHSDKDVPVQWLGPFNPGSELDSFLSQQQLDVREFFTAFACTKACPGTGCV